MLLGTMSGKIPQSKRKEVNCIHFSSSKDFSGEVRVGKKPTCMEWKSMAAFSRNPLPALCPQGLSGRAQCCSSFLPGRNRRAHRSLLKILWQMWTSHSGMFPRRRGKGGLMGFFLLSKSQAWFSLCHHKCGFACTLVSPSPKMVHQAKGGLGMQRSWQPDHFIKTQTCDCEVSSAFHVPEESRSCPLLFAAWLMPQMKS